MEKYLEKLPPNPFFIGIDLYKDREDGFIYCNFTDDPLFWQEKVDNFQARESDVIVASYPRSGTTWTAELTWLILNDLDFDTAKKINLIQRASYIKCPNQSRKEPISNDSAVDAFDIPCCYRTHIPYTQLPKSIIEKNCKIVYSLRNPKDMLVSRYNFAIKHKFCNYKGDFDTMVEIFLQEGLTFDPYRKHVLQYWDLRNRENILILTYEERIKDLSSSIRKLGNFLGKRLTDVQIESLAKYCSFESMKKNPSVNLEETMTDFIRKGEVGQWKEYFSENLNNKIDEYIKTHFADSGLEFVFEL